MLATKLQGEITRDRRLVVKKIPRRIAPGKVEVILLRPSTRSIKQRGLRANGHPAFGIWAKRAGIKSSAQFAATLRNRIERRADAGKHRR